MFPYTLPAFPALIPVIRIAPVPCMAGAIPAGIVPALPVPEACPAPSPFVAPFMPAIATFHDPCDECGPTCPCEDDDWSDDMDELVAELEAFHRRQSETCPEPCGTEPVARPVPATDGVPDDRNLAERPHTAACCPTCGRECAA